MRTQTFNTKKEAAEAIAAAAKAAGYSKETHILNGTWNLDTEGGVEPYACEQHWVEGDARSIGEWLGEAMPYLGEQAEGYHHPDFGLAIHELLERMIENAEDAVKLIEMEDRGVKITIPADTRITVVFPDHAETDQTHVVAVAIPEPVHQRLHKELEEELGNIAKNGWTFSSSGLESWMGISIIEVVTYDD